MVDVIPLGAREDDECAPAQRVAKSRKREPHRGAIIGGVGNFVNLEQLTVRQQRRRQVAVPCQVNERLLCDDGRLREKRTHRFRRGRSSNKAATEAEGRGGSSERVDEPDGLGGGGGGGELRNFDYTNVSNLMRINAEAELSA